jgi:hypothetical protein
MAKVSNFAPASNNSVFGWVEEGVRENLSGFLTKLDSKQNLSQSRSLFIVLEGWGGGDP